MVHRAREVLEKLEADSRAAAGKPSPKRPKEAATQQLSFLGQKSPLAEEMEKVDIDSLTPLEALPKPYELQKKAKEE